MRSALACIQNGCPPLELLTESELTARHHCLREECVCLNTHVVFEDFLNHKHEHVATIDQQVLVHINYMCL